MAEQGSLQLLHLSPSCLSPSKGLLKRGGPARVVSWETPELGQGPRFYLLMASGPICGPCGPCLVPTRELLLRVCGREGPGFMCESSQPTGMCWARAGNTGVMAPRGAGRREGCEWRSEGGLETSSRLCGVEGGGELGRPKWSGSCRSILSRGCPALAQLPNTHPRGGITGRRWSRGLAETPQLCAGRHDLGLV